MSSWWVGGGKCIQEMAAGQWRGVLMWLWASSSVNTEETRVVHGELSKEKGGGGAERR